MKQQLGFSIKNLKIIVDKIEMLLINQQKEYFFRIKTVKMQMFFKFQTLLFRDLIFKVIFYALNNSVAAELDLGRICLSNPILGLNVLGSIYPRIGQILTDSIRLDPIRP